MIFSIELHHEKLLLQIPRLSFTNLVNLVLSSTLDLGVNFRWVSILKGLPKYRRGLLWTLSQPEGTAATVPGPLKTSAPDCYHFEPKEGSQYNNSKERKRASSA